RSAVRTGIGRAVVGTARKSEREGGEQDAVLAHGSMVAWIFRRHLRYWRPSGFVTGPWSGDADDPPSSTGCRLGPWRRWRRELRQICQAHRPLDARHLFYGVLEP